MAIEIVRRRKVPTGHILIVRGERGGMLECLSIGDYGKAKNLKADFLGLTNEINGVPHGELLPLSEKWVVTVSTQYGCSMGCVFCDVPRVGPGVNATRQDICQQVVAGLSLHPEIRRTNRLNIHFARMGEPTWNFNVLSAALWLQESLGRAHKLHPVVSTMMPRRNRLLRDFLTGWMAIKNYSLHGEAGLQISLNSTDEDQRRQMFHGNASTLPEIRDVMFGLVPVGRKIALNFALHHDYIVDPGVLLRYFDPARYLIKITPMHMTRACREREIETPSGYEHYYPYKTVEEACKKAGYDVIVFVPSIEEDESKITCGNAILSEQAREMLEEDKGEV